MPAAPKPAAASTASGATPFATLDRTPFASPAWERNRRSRAHKARCTASTGWKGNTHRPRPRPSFISDVSRRRAWRSGGGPGRRLRRRWPSSTATRSTSSSAQRAPERGPGPRSGNGLPRALGTWTAGFPVDQVELAPGRRRICGHHIEDQGDEAGRRAGPTTRGCQRSTEAEDHPPRPPIPPVVQHLHTVHQPQLVPPRRGVPPGCDGPAQPARRERGQRTSWARPAPARPVAPLRRLRRPPTPPGPCMCLVHARVNDRQPDHSPSATNSRAHTPLHHDPLDHDPHAP